MGHGDPVRAILVAGIAAVAFGHPHRFRGFTFWTGACKFNQIALSAIDGLEDLGNGGAADLPAFGSQLGA